MGGFLVRFNYYMLLYTFDLDSWSAALFLLPLSAFCEHMAWFAVPETEAGLSQHFTILTATELWVQAMR